MRFTLVIVAAALAVIAMPRDADAQGAQFLKRFQDWATYSHEGSDGGKLCFAVSQPKDLQPKREDVYLYVSSWPQEGVSNEISVKSGYTYADNSTSSATVGSEVFEMFTEGEHAWVASIDQEKKLVSAMRRGLKLTIRGRSSDGAQSTDEYSLSGITAALNYLDSECR